jgi:gas vesicle protein
MVGRLIFIATVVGLAGTAGLSVGLLYAPAPGEETRRKLSEVYEEHEGTFTELFARGKDAFNDAVDAMGRVEAADDS